MKYDNEQLCEIIANMNNEIEELTKRVYELEINNNALEIRVGLLLGL